MYKDLNLCSLEYLSISDIKKIEKQSVPNSDAQISEVLIIGAYLLQLSTFFWKLYKRYSLMKTQAYKHAHTQIRAHTCI